MEKEKLFLRLSTAISVLFFLWFSALSAHLLAQSLPKGLLFLLLCAVAFLFISILRRLIGAKRPYQKNREAAPHHGRNDSFPSRHAYSCFFIATVTLFFFPIAAIPLFLIAPLLCALRVLSGVHYTVDVIAGALFGLSFGLITMLFL